MCVTLIRVSIEENIERVFVCCPGAVQLVKECWADNMNIPSLDSLGQLFQQFHVGSNSDPDMLREFW